MARELKQNQAPEASSSSSSAASSSSAGDGPSAPHVSAARSPRWFAPPSVAAPAPPPRRPSYVAIGLSVVALVLVAVARGLLLRALLPLALAAAAIALVLGARKRRAPRPPAPRPERRRGLALERGTLCFHVPDSPPRVLLRAEEPFGVTLVATRRRDRAVAAISSAEGTFYVGAVFDRAARHAHAAMLARASTVANDDTGLEAIGPDGEPIELAAAELAALVDALADIEPASAERFVLSDAHGAPVVLDGHELCVGERRFDLTAPLEWRAIVFQEAFGQAVAVYQGTWIRQSGSELVLVSLLPSIAPVIAAGDVEASGIQELDRAAARDARLLQAAPEEPPPLDQRVAIERLFMLPIRSALDRAPRPSKQPSRIRV